jgi:hypothetical protein
MSQTRKLKTINDCRVFVKKDNTAMTQLLPLTELRVTECRPVIDSVQGADHVPCLSLAAI